MININLLPPELKISRIEAKRNASLFSVSLVVIIFSIVLGIVALTGKSTVEAYLDSIKQDVSSSQDQNQDAKALQEAALLINDRALTFADINAKRAIWSQILTDLSVDAPTDVQFINLTCDTAKSPNFVLQGQTTTEREIIKFKEKLESSPLFKNVAFKSSDLMTDTQSQTESLKFTLEFDLEKYSSSQTKK